MAPRGGSFRPASRYLRRSPLPLTGSVIAGRKLRVPALFTIEQRKIDGRNATPQEIRDHLAALGLGGSIPAGMFAAPPREPPTDARTDADTMRRRADSDTEERVRRATKLAEAEGRPMNVRSFNDAEFAAYLRLHRLGGRTPRRGPSRRIRTSA